MKRKSGVTVGDVERVKKYLRRGITPEQIAAGVLGYIAPLRTINSIAKTMSEKEIGSESGVNEPVQALSRQELEDKIRDEVREEVLGDSGFDAEAERKKIREELMAEMAAEEDDED